MFEIYSRQDNTEKLIATHKKIVSIDKKDYSSNYFPAKYNTDIAYGLAVCYSRIEYYTKAIEVLDLIIFV